MVTSGQNDVLIYFLSSHLVKYLFTLLEDTFTLLVKGKFESICKLSSNSEK